MLFKFSSIAALVSAASALTLQTPTNWASGSSVNLTWTPSASDQTFSFELSNPTIFNNALGLANNVDPTLGHITLTLPIVPPGSGYTLQAVNISDINTVYAQTGSFAIANTPSSVASSASSASLTLASSSGSGYVTLVPSRGLAAV
ncbi:hypothetical protein B0H21DRAFT_734988 [Amylocystis lapponica]|nr:hypothetical protein B0H21DRAFT_734988 [Amylocystis lapponica]